MQNIQMILPVITKVLGRDFTPEVSMFFRARAAVGQSLNQEGQVFFQQNWPKLVDFMETDEGKVAISKFLDAWVESMIPKSITSSQPTTTTVQEQPQSTIS